MPQHHLSRHTKLTMVNAEAASAGTAINTSSVDMQDYRGAWFFGTMVTANASNFANLARSIDDTTFNDLTGTKVTPGDAGDQFSIDVWDAGERYLRLEVDRGGADTVVGEIFCLQYGAPRKLPATHGTTVDHEYHANPGEGTA